MGEEKTPTHGVRRHDFNSLWWGEPVGIVDAPEFFERPLDEQLAELDAYAWCEFAAPASAAPDGRKLLKAGFFQADVQVNFRLDLRRVAPPACANEYCVEFADQHPFAIAEEAMAPFQHERFLQLPGGDLQRVAARYVLWSKDLIARSPERCLQLIHQGRVQGWFLSQPGGGRLHLTLAMLAREATVSGADLYRLACAAYAARGERLGDASFSVANTPVHNLYAGLGARFLEPKFCWLRA